MTRRASFSSIMLLVVALALGACGDDDREGSFTTETGTGTQTTGTQTTGTGTTTTPSGGPSRTLDVSEVEFRLEPARFSVDQPGVVEFVVRNDGGTVHALEVEGPTGEFETEEIQPGEQARLRADVGEAGTYKLYCPVGNHEAQGMVGRLVVGGGAGSGDDSGGNRDGDDSGDDQGSDDDGGGEPGQGGSDDDTGGAAPPSGY